MTTDETLPMPPQVAVADALWYAENPPFLTDQAAEILRAAKTMALVIKRTERLQASRIGADEFLARNDYDSPSFYAGVAFAFSKVSQKLGGWEPSDD
jgi:hypothetical protein